MKKITLLAMSLVMALTVKAQYGVDITSQLTNSDFEDGSTGWSITGGFATIATAATNGYNGTSFMEDWTAAPGTLADLDCSQTISVENGLYVVTALAHAIQQDNSSLDIVGIDIYANKDAVPVKTISATEYKVSTVVEDGKLKVGFRGVGTNANWIAWDYVRITQYTAETIEAAQVMYAKDEMNALAAIADELAAGKIQASLAQAMAESAAAVETVTTWEAAKALWDTFKAQVEEAKASTEAYIALQAKIEQAYEWQEKGLSDGVDEFEAALTAAETSYEEATLNVEEAHAAAVTLDNAIYDFFLLNADGEIEYDMTDLRVTNPTVRTTNAGWTYNPEDAKATTSYNIAEFYNKDFDMSQTIEDLPNGMYVVYMTGYYRATGNDNNVGFNAHEDGSEIISAELYANEKSVKLQCLYENDINVINAADPTDRTIGGYNNFANSMAEAEICFDKGFYANNKVAVIVTDGKLTFGIRDKNHGGGSWTAFRDFRLGYLGNFPSVVLANTLIEAQAWLDGHVEILPEVAYAQLSDAIMYAEDYTALGSDEAEVLAAMAEFEAQYASVKNVVALINELTKLVGQAEELVALEYPGLTVFSAAYEAAAAIIDAGTGLEIPEDQTAEAYLQEAIAAFNAAILAYYESQVASPENPADYTYRIALPNFAPIKNYTIPAPWVVANVQASGDVWVGTGQPDAAGDGTTGLSCLNSWSNNFTSMDVHQDIEGLPNGVYSVSARAITQGLGQQHAYATSSVGTVVSEDMTIVGWDSYEWETLTTAKVVVIDGKLRIGFASVSVSAGDVKGWYQVTDFQLKYYGEASEEDLKGAWEASLERAEEMVDILLKGDSKGVQDAIAAASPLAAEGKYVDACQALNPTVAAADSVYNVTKKFKDGNYKTLADLKKSLDANSEVIRLIGAVLDFADPELNAADATHAILDPLNEKLGGYLAYATYLVEAENTLATIKGAKEEHKTFVKDEVITPQVADLVAQLRTADDCNDLLAKLQKAMKALEGTTYVNLPAGDLTEDLVANPTIDDSNATGWTVVKGTGNGPTITGQHYDGTTSNRYLDSWNGAAGSLNFTAYQEIVGLPDGTYQLTVAARTDGDNAWIFAAPEALAADTAKWAASTEWAMIKNNGAIYGEIWYEDSLAWVAANGAIDAPYFNANNGTGWGWSYDTINVVVTNHYLAIGITANSALTCKDAFTGTWMGADDWKLVLVEKAATQSDYNPFAGIENVEAIVPAQLGIYDLFGRRVETPTATGIYIVNGKKTFIKK